MQRKTVSGTFIVQRHVALGRPKKALKWVRVRSKRSPVRSKRVPVRLTRLPVLEKLTRYCLGQWRPADKAQFDALDAKVMHWAATMLLERRKERTKAPRLRLMHKRMSSFIPRGYAPPTRQKSLLVDTPVARTHVPLLKWFRAIGIFVASAGGVSAFKLQEVLKLGSYSTAMELLAKIRALAGRVLPAALGSDAKILTLPVPVVWPALHMKKDAAVLVAVSRPAKVTTILIRLAQEAEEEAEQRRSLAGDTSPPAQALGRLLGARRHDTSQDVSDTNEILPEHQRLLDDLVRWLRRIHRRPPALAKLQPYLNEYAFRFDVRGSHSTRHAFQNLVFLALGLDPEQPLYSPAPEKPLYSSVDV